MNNLPYLFAAHFIFWTVLFLYIYGLVKKNGELKREIEKLKHSSQDRD